MSLVWKPERPVGVAETSSVRRAGSNRRGGVVKHVKSMMLATALLAALGATADAQKFPAKEVTLVVPLSPGGGSDLTMRALARATEKTLGSPVIVVNKPGAGGAVGLTEVAKTKADGHTLVMLSEYIYNLPATQAVGFKADSFASVATVNFDAAAVVVGKNSKLATLRDLVEYAKTNPGVVTLGNSGFGNIWHISAVALEKATGVKFIHVPFNGAAPTVTATLGGHVSAMIASAPEVASQVQAGQLRILAVLSGERNPAFPDVPTAKEQGVDLQFGTWRGVGAPAGVPAEHIAVLEKAIKAAAESPEFKDFMKKQGFNILYRGSAETAKYMVDDAPRFAGILGEIGLLHKK
jgi:tripartite-type tricarboxylate transporter receptor subunit TctC